MKRMRFLEWCKKPKNDLALIHYSCIINGEYYNFTSDDYVDGWILTWLHDKAMIDLFYIGEEGDEYFFSLSE